MLEAVFGIGLILGGTIAYIILYLTSAKGTYNFTLYCDEDGELDGIYNVHMQILQDKNLLKKKRIILIKDESHK